MNPSQSIMNDQHRATPEQWQAIEANGHLPTRSTILELLQRVQALEAAQHAHVDASHVIDPEREKMAQMVMQAAGFAPLPLSSEAELRAATRLHSYKVGKAEPVENWGEGHTLVQPPVYAAEAQPNHPAKPDSSLVEQVTDALVDVEAIDEDDDDPTYKYTSDAIRNGEGVIHLQARAAIRVIASELRAQGFVYAADWLEQEAKR